MSKTQPSAACLHSLKKRYRLANCPERGAILDEFAATSGYYREYAIAILRGSQQPHRGPVWRPRARYYQAKDRGAVLQLADWFDEISSRRLRAAMDVILPIPLLGIDSDNGAEFINQELMRSCDQERLTFTRGRVGRKNDQPFVEQKNWSLVRWIVGYERYDTPRQVRRLNQVYAVYRLYINLYFARCGVSAAWPRRLRRAAS